jgi:hypothetical protein
MKYTLDLTQLSPLKTRPYPWQPVQLQWLEALRSGKYKQGQGFLRDTDDRYCCLGVYGQLLGAEMRLKSNSHGYAFTVRGEGGSNDDRPLWTSTSWLPAPLRKAGFLQSDIGRFARNVRFPGVTYGEVSIEGVDQSGHGSLAGMNDARVLPDGNMLQFRAFTFLEIADYIQFDPWNIFFDPASAPNETSEEIFASGGL